MAENNPYQELVNEGVMTQEEMSAKLAEDNNNTLAPVVNTDESANEEVDGGESTNDTSSDDLTADSDNKPKEPFYKSLGYEKDDDVVAAINEFKGMQSRVNEIQKREAELTEKASVLSKFENPYSHETIGKLDKAYEQLKIEDFGLLGRIVGATRESIAGDPIQAIVIGKILSDPTILSGGITYQDLIDIEKDIRDDVDLDDTNSLAFKRLTIEANQALTKINTFQQSLADTKGRYTFAHEEANATAKQREDLLQGLTPKVEELMKSGKQKFSVGDYSLDLSFSKEEVSEIITMASRIAVDRGININTAEGVKKLNEIVQLTAKGAAVRSSNYEKALIESVYAKAKEDLIKEDSLGRPNPRTPATGGSSAKKKSESQAYFDKLLKDVGN